jgi:serine-type D-Ala-D-Ala carboxypeptidase/endopeptidase (penicillin-binding protein 4)
VLAQQAKPESANDPLSIEFEKFKADPTLKHASYSLLIKNLTSGKNLLNYNSDLALTPASTQKLLTTAAALELLGEYYTFKTYISYTGQIENNVLHGNLIIKGGGDPTLESENFADKKQNLTLKQITEDLKKLNIKKIDGAIIADAEIFDDAITPNNWLWTDIGNYYGAGPHGLSYKDNKVTVYFKSGKQAGDSTQIVGIKPAIKGLKIFNSVTTGQPGTGDNAYFFGAENQYNKYVKGTIPANRDSFAVEASMPDASKFFVDELKEYLQQNGIITDGEATTTTLLKSYNLKLNTNGVIIDSIVSPQLKRIVYFTNIKSINLYAEHLLKSISLFAVKQGSTADGIKIVDQLYRNLGIDIGGLKLQDGSGLSPMNKLTTKQQVAILSYMNKQPSFNTFYESLPVAGKSGSMASMFKGTKAEGVIHAKSGYIGGVRAFTGYFKNSKNETCAFSFIVNNYDCTSSEMRKKMEVVMGAFVE